MDEGGRRVAAIALLVAVAAGCSWSGWRWVNSGAPELGPRSDLCAALAEDVAGVGVIRSGNGISGSGAWWIQVLGRDGLQTADAASRRRIAHGVAADAEGFAAVWWSSPSDLRPALERLRGLALDPSRAAKHADDPGVERDIVAVVRTSDCGWGP